MPQIIRDSKQDKALETIAECLAEIGKINAIIASGEYSFVLQCNGSKKAKLDIAPAQNEKILIALKDRKKDLVKEAKTVAKANRIAFDQKEELAMSDAGHKRTSEEAPVNETEAVEAASEGEPESDGLDLL